MDSELREGMMAALTCLRGEHPWIPGYCFKSPKMAEFLIKVMEDEIFERG